MTKIIVPLIQYDFIISHQGMDIMIVNPALPTINVEVRPKPGNEEDVDVAFFVAMDGEISKDLEKTVAKQVREIFARKIKDKSPFHDPNLMEDLVIHLKKDLLEVCFLDGRKSLITINKKQLKKLFSKSTLYWDEYDDLLKLIGA